MSDTPLAPQYDAIVIGSGPIGAHVAKYLAAEKKRVLVLEAGRASGLTYEGYRSYVANYHMQVAKDTNSPYPANPNAPSPREIDLTAIPPGTPDLNGYQVEMGPQAFASTYLRMLGGTSLHWLGTVPRFLPNDFKLNSKYGVGVDWPVTYDELQEHYCQAEWSIGVSADKADQESVGLTFPKDYEYPMERIPPSYSDQVIDKATQKLEVELAGKRYPVRVSSLAQARNSIPRTNAKPPEPFLDVEFPKHPVGAVGAPEVGLRCEGNSTCIPICPVQAKYSSLKTIAQMDMDYVTLVTQAVVTKLRIGANGRISGVEYTRYGVDGGATKQEVATAKVYVLAAHAIENAKLLLASGAANSSDQVGRNLMDHPFSSSWALAPKSMGSFRGPLQTSGIETLRDGAFRSEFAAFRIDLSNVGWDIVPPEGPEMKHGKVIRPGGPMPSPFAEVGVQLGQKVFGKQLREHLGDFLPRQVRVGYDIEQLPEARNRVTISREFKDALGCYRPVIDYDLSDYTWQSMVESIKVSQAVYDAMGIPKRDQHFVTNLSGLPDERNFRAKDGKDYMLSFVGAGHHIGTHRMGVSRTDSVVNRDQRSWDHENLYIVGCGSFPTTGTANPTLTALALTFPAVKDMLKQLR